SAPRSPLRRRHRDAASPAGQLPGARPAPDPGHGPPPASRSRPPHARAAVARSRMTKSSGAILLGPSMVLGPAGPPGEAGRSKSAPADFVDGDSRPEGVSS